MFIFPLVALFATALFIAAIPVVLFALMLETVAQRASKVVAVAEGTPRSVRLAFHTAT